MDVKDKVIIVTGASEGIGLATATLLDEQGAKLVLAARSAEKIAALTEGMQDAIAVPTDMRDAAAIKNLVAKAMEKYGRIDVLVNNAGQGMIGPLESIDIEKYQQLIELNVYGPLRWSPAYGLPDEPENYNRVTYSLDADGDATTVTITQDNCKTEEGKKQSESNWTMVLNGMKELLEKAN